MEPVSNTEANKLPKQLFDVNPTELSGAHVVELSETLRQRTRSQRAV